MQGLVPQRAPSGRRQHANGDIARSNGTSPIAVTDLTRPSPPKVQRVAIEHAPSCLLPEYEGAPKPDNEEERQNYLCSLNVLNTPADSRFDDITRLVRLVLLEVAGEILVQKVERQLVMLHTDAVVLCYLALLVQRVARLARCQIGEQSV